MSLSRLARLPLLLGTLAVLALAATASRAGDAQCRDAEAEAAMAHLEELLVYSDARAGFYRTPKRGSVRIEQLFRTNEAVNQKPAGTQD